MVSGWSSVARCPRLAISRLSAFSRPARAPPGTTVATNARWPKRTPSRALRACTHDSSKLSYGVLRIAISALIILTRRAPMTGFRETLREQRWDDHRYYHHSRINQSLHLVSAVSFLVAYVMVFFDPGVAGLIGWLVSMNSRQAGHFFFEPKHYDEVNQATHEYKEEIKVGYNLRRKIVLTIIWAGSPLQIGRAHV